MKKSFIIYKDSLDVLEKLSDEQAGQLFKAICAYQNGEEYELDYVMEFVFLPFQKQFERDAIKYEKRCEVNRINGSKGGKQTQANGSKRKRTVANQADSDSDSDSDSDNKKEKYIKEKEIFDSFRKRYSGKKRGNDTEFNNFIKKHKDWRNILPLLEQHPLIFDVEDNKYIPHLSKWINNREWELESETTNKGVINYE